MMDFNKGAQRENNQNAFVASAYYMANAMAAIATILLVPILWRQVGSSVEALLHELYDPDMAQLAYFAVWGCSWAAVFFALRMTFVTACVSLAIAGAIRFA